MPCLIENGRVEQCKDSISGLQTVYFINYGIEPSDVTYSGVGADDIDAIAGVSDIYKYELKGTNAFETTIQSSRANGTTFFEQTLTIQLKRQDITTHKNVKLLAYGRPHIIIHTRNDQWFLMGIFEGADVNAGKIATGTEYGDFNGYELTFVAMEKVPANFINATSESDLATTVLGGATVVDS